MRAASTLACDMAAEALAFNFRGRTTVLVVAAKAADRQGIVSKAAVKKTISGEKQALNRGGILFLIGILSIKRKLITIVA